MRPLPLALHPPGVFSFELVENGVEALEQDVGVLRVAECGVQPMAAGVSGTSVACGTAGIPDGAPEDEGARAWYVSPRRTGANGRAANGIAVAGRADPGVGG